MTSVVQLSREEVAAIAAAMSFACSALNDVSSDECEKLLSLFSDYGSDFTDLMEAYEDWHTEVLDPIADRELKSILSGKRGMPQPSNDNT